MSASDVQTTPYKGSVLKTLLARLAFPVFWVLNRPAFRLLNEAVYDVALRLNGFAIGFKGKHGLTFPEEAFLKQFLPKVRSGVLMDVGANHGTYSRFLGELRPDLRVLAFEPHPKSFALLKQNTKDGQVEQFNMALSDSGGTMKLYDFANNDGSTQASLSLDAVQLFDSAAVSYDVKVQTLDRFCEENGIDHIAFLKIDTEGFDINVLRGARRLLGEKKIDAIQFEFIPACIVTRVSMRDFFEELSGYDLYRLCVSGALVKLGHYNVKRCEIFVVQNIIAFRQSYAGIDRADRRHGL